ncbi:MAG: hypothetical protein ACXVQQ_06340 [Gaiellaceae bacterium]
MADHTEDQLRDLLELWNRNSQGLSEAQMVALLEWDQTPEATRSKLQAMIDARRTGVRPQRLSASEELFLQERGLGGSEPKPQKPSLAKKFFRRG